MTLGAWAGTTGTLLAGRPSRSLKSCELPSPPTSAFSSIFRIFTFFLTNCLRYRRLPPANPSYGVPATGLTNHIHISIFAEPRRGLCASQVPVLRLWERSLHLQFCSDRLASGIWHLHSDPSKQRLVDPQSTNTFFALDC